MKVRALRGVCVGIERHLVAGDVADVDDASVTFLVSIKAVELVKDEPPPVVDETPSEVKATPAKAGKSKEK